MSLSKFHEVSFPVPLALAATGGPERRTEVVTLASGAEVRSAVWAGSRRRWDVGSAALKLDALQALVDFFEARGGRLRRIHVRLGALAGGSPAHLREHFEQECEVMGLGELHMHIVEDPDLPTGVEITGIELVEERA